MPLMCNDNSQGGVEYKAVPPLNRGQTSHSNLAKSVIKGTANTPLRQLDGSVTLPAASIRPSEQTAQSTNSQNLDPKTAATSNVNGNVTAANDTPDTTAPPSPIIPPKRQNSGDQRPPRTRPTTLDIPGLTKSRVSPDGKIASRDVGSKLVIVMVGLPARGKSYITKKMARYLNWLQHDTRIFNVGERRRVAAGRRLSNDDRPSTRDNQESHKQGSRSSEDEKSADDRDSRQDASKRAAEILINGQSLADLDSPSSIHIPRNPIETSGLAQPIPTLNLPDSTAEENHSQPTTEGEAGMDQSASFFDPSNRKAAQIREQAAIDTLDDLLKYILDEGGSVGILDATNSTLERRKLVMKHIRARAPGLNVLFIESLCIDSELLERNMRLKLSGPDYRGKDPERSLADFRQRVAIYEKAYVPLGAFEEAENLPYVQMIDVGRKVISHQVRGFLSAQAVYYLLNFNLAPRQIWITRHGQSIDNLSGRIGGDSSLSSSGHAYARALSRFISAQRNLWDIRQREKEAHSHMPPLPGDSTPPNPHYTAEGAGPPVGKSLCVWTSMLKRSVQTAAHFDEDDFDTKQMRMLDELFAGHMEGLTYPEIRAQFPADYDARRRDKLLYRYPGPGGEGYLDVIHRLRPVIVELERMEDHCLLIGHRSVARVLLAYFMGLGRDEVTDLDVPLGVVYCLEPRPYGVDMRVFRYTGAGDVGGGGEVNDADIETEGVGGSGAGVEEERANSEGTGDGVGDEFEELLDYELKRSKDGHD